MLTEIQSEISLMQGQIQQILNATAVNTAKLLKRQPRIPRWPESITTDIFKERKFVRIKVDKSYVHIAVGTPEDEVAGNLKEAGFSQDNIDSILEIYRQVTS